MKIRRSTLVLACGLAILAKVLCGCMTVPATTIKYDPQTKTLDLGSPKDVVIDRATVVESNGFFSLTLEGYSAKNNYQVIKAVIEHNEASMKTAAENGGVLIGKVLKEVK